MRERHIQKKFYLSDKEDERFKKMAEKVMLSQSSLFRSLINNFEPKEKPDEKFYDAMNHIRAIGVNINQIAKKANSLGYIDDYGYMKTVNELQKLIRDIYEVFLMP